MGSGEGADSIPEGRAVRAPSPTGHGGETEVRVGGASGAGEGTNEGDDGGRRDLQVWLGKSEPDWEFPENPLESPCQFCAVHSLRGDG